MCPAPKTEGQGPAAMAPAGKGRGGSCADELEFGFTKAKYSVCMYVCIYIYILYYIIYIL